MFRKTLKTIDPYTGFADQLLLILTLFTVTFFVYRDFGIRMMLGFGVLCLILGVHVLRRIHRRSIPAPGPVEIAFCLLALAVLLNFLRLDSRHDSDSISYIIAMGICLFFVLLAPRGGGYTRNILVCFLIAAVLIACFVLLFTFRTELFLSTVYPHLSQVAQRYLDYFLPQGYGVSLGGCTFTDYVLFLGITACCAWLVRGNNSAGRTAALVGCAAVLLMAIVAVGRRGELLAALVCCAVVLLMMLSFKQRIVLILVGGAALAAVLAGAIAFLPQLKEIELLRRYLHTLEGILEGYDFTSGRFQLFGLAIDGFKSAPIFGIGWDQYVTLVPVTLTDIEDKVISDAHNIYLQLLCETGIVGTVLVLTPMFYTLWHSGGLLMKLRHRKGSTALELCCASFMIQFFLLFVGLLDPSFQKIVFWCFYAIAVILLLAAMDREEYHPDGPLSRLFLRVTAVLKKGSK